MEHRPGDRVLTRKDLPGLLVAFGALAVFIALGATGHPWLAGAVPGGTIYAAYLAMPRENREAMGRELLRQERTPLRRVMKVVETVVGLALLAAIAVAYWKG